MSSVSDRLTKQFGRLNSIKASCSSDVFEPNVARYDDSEAKQRALLVEWLNGMLSNVNLPPKASTEELRACLIDGTVLLQILNRLRPGSVNEGIGTNHSENVKRFLAFMDQLGIPKFEMSDLEKGSLKTVMDTLLALRAQSVPGADRLSATSTPSRANGDASPNGPESRFQQAFRSPNMSESSAASMYHVGHKFHEVFQLKHGRYVDLSAAKISEMMKSNSLDNAPTQSLLSVVNGILDESIERKPSEIPQRVACLLRKVVQEIERRISTQADHLRTQNNLFKAREEKYESRLRVLEALASGCREESGIVMEQLQQSKTQKSTVEEKKKVEEDMLKLMKKEEAKDLELSELKQELETVKNIQKSAMEEKKRVEEDMLKLMKEKEQKDLELSALKQELETIQKSAMEEKKRVEEDMLKLMKEKEQKDLELSALKQELETIQKSAMEEKKKVEEDMLKLMKEKEQKDLEFSALKQELETVKKKHEMHCLQMETEGKGSKRHLEEKIKELERLLDASKDKMKVLEKVSNSKSQNWSKKEHICRRYMEFQFGAVRELRLSSDSIKHEIIKSQKSHKEQLDHLGARLKALVDATENYHLLLAENRKMFNELQDLKGNIRVYCRIRPFLPGQSSKQTIIQYIGENGELVVANPSKQGKDGHKMFRFNKVYGPTATQVEVFSDTQPLIRSVLDGYNVCIFAYGQTGSGKTYTMTGPSGASEEDWGVNYRALNDLFHISQNRSGSYMYEVAVQMVEIYNEQVRDLLSSGSQKRLGILSTSQPTGLAVPDASMHPVGSTSDVLELMDIGLKNRAVGATAMNERSSRSHSVVSIHVRGKDLHTSGTLQGNLHLVDLAGSERVDRSEVTGDRLREAQHINKSLSALGDVIFALAQKGPHVPYRNSKLTQLLQSSLGGQAKTLMFVQLNPDVDSYFETMSTLKFAERVSGIELGAARSSKEGRDVRELMEQVASLKDTISKKDDEIEKLQLVKDLKHVSPGSAGERLGTGSLRSGYLSTSNDSLRSLSGGKDIARSEKAASDQDSYSENGDKRSASDIGQGAPSADGEGDNEERLSDASDGSFSAGTEPDGSADESTKSSDKLEKNKVASSIRRLQKHAKTKLTTVSGSRESIKSLTNTKKPSTSNLTPHKSAITKRWQ